MTSVHYAFPLALPFPERFPDVCAFSMPLKVGHFVSSVFMVIKDAASPKMTNNQVVC